MTVIDINLESNSKTAIQKFYAGENVLITGGTGFLGKLLIDKLLRSCPDLSSIFIVIRPKKGQDAHQRLDSLFDDVVFERMKKEVPKYRLKVTAIPGDCSLPGLGISTSDREFLIRETSVVFHVAATVRFDEKIKNAVGINVVGTKEILDLSRQMKRLKAHLHVSTAYSNCPRKEIDEKFYDPPMTGDSIIKLVQSLDDKKLDAITPTLIGDYPNTYAYTKCIAEQVVKQYGSDLPTGIFRPAMVISTHEEPVPGWIDNVFGPTGPLVAGGAGLIRTMHMDQECTAELVPADLCVNSLIAAAWDVANNKNVNADPPIYNYVAAWNKPITWGEYIDLAFKHAKKIPSIRSIWCYSITSTKNLYLYYILSILLHIIPALLIDAGLLLIGKEAKILKIYKKIHKFTGATSYFGLRKWSFSNLNTRTLWERLNPEDKELFSFSMHDFDWDSYMKECVTGLRLYIFKDDPTNIPVARKRMAKIVLLHRFLKYTLFALTMWGLYIVFSSLMSLSTIGLVSVSESIPIR